MKSDVIDNRLTLSLHRASVPASKLNRGSLAGKYPVIMDDGKTVIFISDRNLETETRNRYIARRR